MRRPAPESTHSRLMRYLMWDEQMSDPDDKMFTTLEIFIEWGEQFGFLADELQSAWDDHRKLIEQKSWQ